MQPVTQVVCPLLCIAFMDLITHTHTAPYSFFYWSTNRELVRIILSAMRTSSVNCPSSLTEPSQTLASLSSLVTFTIEQGDGIYFLGDFNCTTSTPPQVDQSVLFTDLSGSATISPIFVATEVRLLESFTDTAILEFPPFAAFFDTTMPGACPASRTPQISLPLGTPIELLRMYRSAKQPLPGMCVCVCGGGGGGGGGVLRLSYSLPSSNHWSLLLCGCQ